MHFQALVILAISLPSITTVTARAAGEQPPETDMADFWHEKDFKGAKVTAHAAFPSYCGKLSMLSLTPAGMAVQAFSGKARKGFKCTVWAEENCDDAIAWAFDDKKGARDLSMISDMHGSWRCERLPPKMIDIPVSALDG